MTASLAGFAISLTRHSAIGALFSFSIAAALWSNSALFHSGVLAHDFWAVFADSMTPLTSPWVQAVWVYGKKVDQQYSIRWKQKLTSLKRKLKNNNNFLKKKSQYHIIVLLLPILLNCINKTVKSTWWHRWVFSFSVNYYNNNNNWDGTDKVLMGWGQKGIDIILCSRLLGTLDLEMGLPGGGIDDGNRFSRRGFAPLAICIVVEDITIYDLCKNATPCHFWAKWILILGLDFR